jgi:hypothetical protein
LLIPSPPNACNEPARFGESASGHFDASPASGVILWGTPDLEASRPCLEDGLGSGVGGDVESARRVKHRFMRRCSYVKDMINLLLSIISPSFDGKEGRKRKVTFSFRYTFHSLKILAKSRISW